jgi:general secretion pathway protein E/type IV pilus assembly protein PilB
MLNEEQATSALNTARQQNKDVIEVLCKETGLTEAEILKALAAQYGLETINLHDVEIPTHVKEMVPGDIAHRYKIIPVSYNGDTLTVALSDPLDIETIDSLRYILKHNVEAIIATSDDIKMALSQHYANSEYGLESVLEEITEGSVSLSASDAKNMIDTSESGESDEPIIKLVNLIIIEAFRKRASDIHLEPLSGKFRVRYRIDGVLQEVDGPPRRLHPTVISRLKIMADMKIGEKRLPQDGRININVMGRSLDLRVNTIPTNHGESVVMRILDKEGLMLGLPKLGFFSDDQQTFENLIQLPDGIILVTGPTGSGKTTTLYACLNHVNKPDRKIITVEDPVEYQLSGINQVHVHADIGMTFSAALRAILRQAPNIIMIGEIRDLETAEIAVNAALTGHLVFSTLHTNDAPSAVPRLIDIGVKPFLVASSVRAIMAQRLVRHTCVGCKAPYTPADAELRMLGPAAQQIASAELLKGAGCDICGGSGYKGRIGLFEIFQMNDEVRHMIGDEVTTLALQNKAREIGMRTMREDGIRKVIANATTLEEVFRATSGGH